MGILTLSCLPLKGLCIWASGLNRRSWSRISVNDLKNLVWAILIFNAGYVFVVLFFLNPLWGVPRSIPFIEAILALVLLGGARMGVRCASEYCRALGVRDSAKRTLIARELLRHPESGLIPVAFLDDDPKKRIESHLGIRVKGAIDDLAKVASSTGASVVLIAIPSAPGSVVRHIVDLAKGAKLEYRIVPGVYEILCGNVSVSQIREVDVEDLLRRDPVRLECESVSAYLEGRTVLVTGAGGSIGSEIVRQVAGYHPERILLLGRGENSLFQIRQELAFRCPDLDYQVLVCDVRNRDRLSYLFGLYLPEVVFHAAAHKHVPLMEENPDEAVLNNVFGTRNVAQLCLEYGVDRLVNISTDKAVNPSSVMGASKRIAEKVVKSVSRGCAPEQAFVSVRFGNVLGSRGSVVPIFKEQIRRGGPVTVTHPEMTRYFMTIPEAAQLVLQAASQAENGSVYVLDMGNPVRIVDLARDLIRLSGFEPGSDIPIAFTGLRPGEKLYEELLTAEEGVTATRHEKIYKAKSGDLCVDFEEKLEVLRRSALTRDEWEIKRAIRELVPTFKMSESTSQKEIGKKERE